MSVESYLDSKPDQVQIILSRMRAQINAVRAGIGETISYGIPAFTYNGRVFAYIAAWRHHVSMYPIPDLDDSLELRVAPYRAGNGTLHFALDEEIPYDLVAALAALLLAQRTQGSNWPNGPNDQRSEEKRTAVSPSVTPGHTRAPEVSSFPDPITAWSPTITPSRIAPAPMMAPEPITESFT